MNLVEHTIMAYEKAQRNQSKISSDWRIMDQYSISSKKFKILLNNLCSLEEASYLELGCFRGGTLMAALLHNKTAAAYAVDNFTVNPLGNYRDPVTGTIGSINPEGWPNVKMSLIENLERVELDKRVKVFMSDWDKVAPDYVKIKANIIHLDIPENSSAILKHFDARISNQFVLVVSNWNNSDIREAVNGFIEKNNYQTLLYIFQYSHSVSDSDGWWNGLGLFVIDKNKKVET